MDLRVTQKIVRCDTSILAKAKKFKFHGIVRIGYYLKLLRNLPKMYISNNKLDLNALTNENILCSETLLQSGV
jgi:hypothetical protein